MGSNLAKAPLLAVLYAALYNLVSWFFPFSQGYSNEFLLTVYPNSMYYIMLIVYGLWISVILAVVFANAKSQKFGLVLPVGLGLVVFSSVLPRLEQILFGYGGGVMTGADMWFQVLVTAVCTILLLVLCVLLYHNPGTPQDIPQPTYKIKRLPLLIKCASAPFAFCVLYVAIWYFLGWRSDAVRAFYGGGPNVGGFTMELIDMLLTNGGMIPFSLLLGLLAILLGLPLLLQLPGKRAMFLAMHTMLCMCSGLYWIVPSVAFSPQVGLQQLIRFGVLMLLYGLLSGIMLHTSLLREDPPPPPAPQPKAGAKAAPRRR